MNEFSECCTAPRHQIFDELCSECLDHAEFIDWDEDEDLEEHRDFALSPHTFYFL